MCKIMLIGDSLPLFSMSAALSDAYAQRLRALGNEVYLLSKAWCRLTEDSVYGSAAQNCTPYPYQKRFYVDPLQIRRSRAELLTAMLGLALKLIDEIGIEALVFADDPSLLPLAELIRSRRSIPCFLYLFDMRRSYECLLDDYMMAGLEPSLQCFDAIFTHPDYVGLLGQLYHVPEEKLVPATPLPMETPDSAQAPGKGDTLYVLVERYSLRAAKLAFSTAKSDLKGVFERLLLCTPNGAADAPKLSLEPEQCVKPEEIPRGAAVITYTELISDFVTSWDVLLLLGGRGWVPLIREGHRVALGDYLGSSVPLGRYHMLSSLRFPWEDAAQACLKRYQALRSRDAADSGKAEAGPKNAD